MCREVVVVNELRSETVHARFLELFEPHFAVRKVPRGKMDAVHQHPAIDIFLMKLRRQRPSKQVTSRADGKPQRATAQAAEGRLVKQLGKPGEKAANVCRTDSAGAEATFSSRTQRQQRRLQLATSARLRGHAEPKQLCRGRKPVVMVHRLVRCYQRQARIVSVAQNST
jgi:hypothetical protein